MNIYFKLKNYKKKNFTDPYCRAIFISKGIKGCKKAKGCEWTGLTCQSTKNEKRKQFNYSAYLQKSSEEFRNKK